MSKPVTKSKILYLFVGVFFAGSSFSQTLSESWYMTQGQTNYKIGNYKAASEAFEKVVQLNPKNSKAFKILGQSLEKQGLFDRAVDTNDKYLKLNPKDATVLFRQANILSWDRYKYRADESIALFKRGLDIEDNLLERRRYAKLLSQSKKLLNEAIKEYEILIAKQPDDNQLRKEYRNLLLWDKSKILQMIAAFEAEIKKNPHDEDAKHALALAYLSTGKHDKEGLELSEELIAKNNNDRELLLARARGFSRVKDYPRAEESFLQVLKLKEDSQVREEYANLLAAQPSKRTNAIDEYRKIIRARPNDSKLHTRLGNILLRKREDAELAIVSYEGAVQINPKNAEAHAGLAKAHAWLGHNDRALYHERVSKELGYNDSFSSSRELERIEEDLTKGREDFAGVKVSVNLNERPLRKDLQQYLGAAAGKELGAFVDGTLDVGFYRYTETNLKSPNGDVDTARLEASLEARPSSRITMTAKGSSYANLKFGRSQEWNLGGLYKSTEQHFGINVAKEMVRDSLLAFNGLSIKKDMDNIDIGSARRTKFSLIYNRKFDDWYFEIIPTTGVVETVDQTSNAYRELQSSAKKQIFKTDSHRLDLQGTFNYSTYQENPQTLGISPEGYDASPQAIVISTTVSWECSLSDEHLVVIHAGPVLNSVKSFNAPRTKFYGGWLADAYWQYRVHHSINIEAEVNYNQSIDQQRSLSAQLVVASLF